MYLKRILNPLPKSFVNKALEKHQATLSTPSTYPPDEILIFCEKFIDSNLSLKIGKRDLDRVNSLSPSASFNTSKKHGGQQGEISLNLPCPGNSGNLRKFAIINNATKYQIDRTNKASDIKINSLIHGHARPATVLEPLKVRIVTCEDAEMYRIKTIQLRMWEDILRDEEFCLTRGEDLIPHIKRHLLLEDSCPLWISGDYSAATDNLNRNIINNVLTQISFYLPPSMRSAFVKNGGSHWIKSSECTYQQFNGQLMGSLTSFPLLCYINYIAYHYCRSLSPKDFSSFCLINGDDILFRATQYGYSIWKDTVSLFGLSPSIGKNYSSKSYFMINSRLFHVKGLEVKEIPFINWALLSTKNTKTEWLDIDRTNPYYPPHGKLLRKLFQQARPSPSVEKKLFGLFCHIHKNEIRRTFKDLLIPEVLGGMGGLTIEEFRKTKLLTRSQRENMVNGFRFRLSLYALRNNLIPTYQSPLMRTATMMGRAVSPYKRGQDPELPVLPILSNHLSFVNKGESLSLPSIKTWLRRVIGKSSFIKSRIPDGVPNLL
jgi:hypothetical protein